MSITMKWEYKRLNNCSCQLSVSRLNELGQEGWELVQVMYAQFSDKAHYIFKRQVEIHNDTN